MIRLATRIRTALSATLALACVMSPCGASANDAWPAKPVKIVVPFSAGGTTDVVARVLGQKLSERWGQSVVIENRAGAGGNVGAEAVAKAAPDGYTLLMASGSVLTVNPHLYKRLPFDVERDFVPITNVASGPMLVVINPAVPAKTLKDLLALAKAKPGSLNFGSAGVGSQVHMAGENLAAAAGLSLVHVPYKGEALAYNDLVAGNIQLVVGNLAGAAPFVTAGKLRALAVTGRERSKLLPDVPTVAEAGLPGFDNTGWFGLVAPAGTPADVVNRIHRDTAAVMDSTEMRARLFVQGMTPVANAPAEFARSITAESARWARVVGDRNLAGN
jgi:tripartite-type tricarboxylate transporter receptor subunit TctC